MYLNKVIIFSVCNYYAEYAWKETTNKYSYVKNNWFLKNYKDFYELKFCVILLLKNEYYQNPFLVSTRIFFFRNAVQLRKIYYLVTEFFRKTLFIKITFETIFLLKINFWNEGF